MVRKSTRTTTFGPFQRPTETTGTKRSTFHSGSGNVLGEEGKEQIHSRTPCCALRAGVVTGVCAVHMLPHLSTRNDSTFSNEMKRNITTPHLESDKVQGHTIKCTAPLKRETAYCPISRFRGLFCMKNDPPTRREVVDDVAIVMTSRGV